MLCSLFTPPNPHLNEDFRDSTTQRFSTYFIQQSRLCGIFIHSRDNEKRKFVNSPDHEIIEEVDFEFQSRSTFNLGIMSIRTTRLCHLLPDILFTSIKSPSLR